MATFNGKNLKITIDGESHSKSMNLVVHNFPSFNYDESLLLEFLDRRKASTFKFSTKRNESDIPSVKLENGVLSATILNGDVKSGDYNELRGKPRPSHADYCWHVKNSVYDFTGGGRFSGRLTSMLCVAGGLAIQYLNKIGIFIGAYVSQVGGVFGDSYKNKKFSFSELVKLREGDAPSLSNKQEMLLEIEKASKNGDSVGGRIDAVVYGLKAGYGDNLFEGLEGKISTLIYSIPAVKGVEFGAGFDLCGMVGSVANDQMYYNGDNVDFYTNNAGGINGGISNGNDITLSVAVRPTPSILKEQNTVDLINKENTKISIKGRHDACIVLRAVPCVESAIALAILDEIL